MAAPEISSMREGEPAMAHDRSERPPRTRSARWAPDGTGPVSARLGRTDQWGHLPQTSVETPIEGRAADVMALCDRFRGPRPEHIVLGQKPTRLGIEAGAGRVGQIVDERDEAILEE